METCESNQLSINARFINKKLTDIPDNRRYRLVLAIWLVSRYRVGRYRLYLHIGDGPSGSEETLEEVLVTWARSHIKRKYKTE